MSDKTWYIVFTKGSDGQLLRYAIEHKFIYEFDDADDLNKWRAELERYFHERTAIKEEVVAIETAEFMTAYNYRELEQ